MLHLPSAEFSYEGGAVSVRRHIRHMFEAAVIFANTPWTFWDFMLFFFIWIPAVMLWFFCLFDIFRRPDLGGGAKFLWLLFILLIPWIGALCYLLFRPAEATLTRT